MKLLKFLSCVSLVAALTFVFTGSVAAEIKIDVLAKRGAAKIMQKWGATLQNLEILRADFHLH